MVIPFLVYRKLTDLFEELKSARIEQPTVLTIGVFDGVHLGHQALLAETVRRSRTSGLIPVAVTFTGHPRLVLGRHSELPHLTSLEQRLSLLRRHGIDHVVTLTFSAELASMPADAFIHLLLEHLSMRHLIIGPDFAMGRDRSGNVTFLTQLSQTEGFGLTVVPPVIVDGERVSSTLIRRAIADSDMKRVRKLLGRCFALEGPVVHGEGRGSSLDIPTANLKIDDNQALPADGVYASRTRVDNEFHFSVTNVGTRPTFGVGHRAVETHLLDYSGNLYGRHLEIAIIEKIRPECKFETPEVLIKQIRSDIAAARRILAEADCLT